MIEFKEVSYHYNGKAALEKVSFEIPEHTVCSVIGRSGSGKTTLLHLLAGLLPIQKGNISINGQPVSGVKKRTAICLQGSSLFPWKTNRENVLLSINGASIDMEQSVNDVFEELEIIDCLHKYPYEISGGEKQRVALARALIQKPELLILDEPTSSLDAITKEVTQNMIMKLHKHYGMTLLTVTHDIEESVFLGEKILVLNSGKIFSEVQNKTFGNEMLRKEIDFYKTCIELREVLGS